MTKIVGILSDGLIEADEIFSMHLETNMPLTDLVLPAATIITILSPDGM